MNNLEHILNKLAADRFYGSIEIKFEGGNPVLLRKTETINKLVLNEHSRYNRGHEHGNQNIHRK